MMQKFTFNESSGKLRNRLVRLLVGAALVAVAGPAAANGQFPAANQVVVAPKDPQMLVLRTTFGVLLSRDRGQNWDWICEQGIGYPNGEEAFLGITSNSTVIGGTFGGLVLSSDHGCSWSGSTDLTSGNPISDLAVNPATPQSAVALSSAFSGDADGKLKYVTKLFTTDDNGRNWAQLGDDLSPTAKALTVDVCKADPDRIYVSAARASEDGSGWIGVLFVSSDHGAHWEERTIELTADERAAYIAGVDPTNADRLYLRTFGVTGRLLVSDNAGKSLRTVFSGGQLLGFALSPDGSRVYIGGPTDGLSVADSTDLRFEQKADIPVRCLNSNGSTLFVCSTEESGFTLGATEDEGTTLTPLLTYPTIRGPLACPADASTAVCPSFWSNQRAALGVNVGGSNTAASDASDAESEGGAPASTEAPRAHSESSCSMPRKPPSSSLLAYLASIVAAGSLMRRRSRPTQGNHANR